jgi:hypothetical protein
MTSLKFNYITIASVATPSRVTGRNLAYTRRTPGQRAAVAAQIALGEAELTPPTQRQAAAMAGASLPYVHLALGLSPSARTRVARGEMSLAEAVRFSNLFRSYLTAPPERASAVISVGVVG